MANQFIGRYRDFDGDVKQISVNLRAAATKTEATAMGDEWQKWSAGGQAGEKFGDEIHPDSGNSGGVEAQGKWRAVLEMVEAGTGDVYKEFIPMIDITKADDPGPPIEPAYTKSGGLTVLNPNHADYVTLKASLDADWLSPNGLSGELSRAYIEE